MKGNDPLVGGKIQGSNGSFGEDALLRRRGNRPD